VAGDNSEENASLRSPKLFGLLVLAMLLITLICLCAIVGLTFFTDQPLADIQNRAFGILDWGFKFGAGALVGLFGGKVTA
jgi:hypothetical protein